ncbi:MAG TPA: hypothetical protein VFH83_11815 [Spirochaetia bacterium]|nr:hypothetical protein [Spirochaetia bacterium]
MGKAYGRLLLVAACFLAAQLLGAQARTGAQGYPELTPLPLSSQLSAMREPLPVETIVDAALEFSGASDDLASADKDKLSGLIMRFRAEVADVTSPADLADRALAFLHKNVFTRYSVRQARVDTALESGVYNCVSSAVIYLILARSVGLSVGGVRTTDHAFDTVLINGQPVDVETTNPYGYNPGSRKEFTDSFGKVTGYSYVPPSNYADRRAIGEKELLSLILYDRVSEYVDGKYLRDALQPAVSAYTLIGSDELRLILINLLGAYSASFEGRKDWPGAIQFLDSAKASLGALPELEKRRREVYHNWVVTLIASNALTDAEAMLEQPAVQASLEDADWANLSIATVQALADQEARANGYAAAASFVVDAIHRIGARPLLLQTYEVYAHNTFALLFNQRKYSEAKTTVDQALQIYPDSHTLSQDLDLVKRALKQ